MRLPMVSFRKSYIDPDSGHLVCTGRGLSCIRIFGADGEATSSVRLAMLGETSPLYDEKLAMLTHKINALIDEFSSSVDDGVDRKLGLLPTSRGFLPVRKVEVEDDDERATRAVS